MELPTSFDSKQSVLQGPLIFCEFIQVSGVADTDQSTNGDCYVEGQQDLRGDKQ